MRESTCRWGARIRSPGEGRRRVGRSRTRADRSTTCLGSSPGASAGHGGPVLDRYAVRTPNAFCTPYTVASELLRSGVRARLPRHGGSLPATVFAPPAQTTTSLRRSHHRSAISATRPLPSERQQALAAKVSAGLICPAANLAQVGWVMAERADRANMIIISHRDQMAGRSCLVTKVQSSLCRLSNDAPPQPDLGATA